MKKNICFPFIGDSFGGSHKSSIIIIKELKRIGFNPIVIIHKRGILEEILRQDNIEYRYYPLNRFVGTSKSKIKNFWNICHNFFFITRILKKNKIDCVHTNDMRMHLSWILPSVFFRKRFIWHQRTILPSSLLVKLLIRIPKKIICISKFVKDSFPKLYHSRIKVIYNPIETIVNRKYEKEDNQFKKKNKIIKIGVFANLQSIKQPSILIQIARKLKTLNKDFQICIFGNDKENLKEELIKNLKKNYITKNVEFFGFKYPIEKWIKIMDIVLATSLADGFGRTIIESMNLKVPVIASNSGGHAEIISHLDNGILVKAQDHNEFVESIMKIIKDKSFKKKLVNEAYKYSQNFLADKITKKVIKEYE